MNLPSLFVFFIGGWGVAPNEKSNLFYYGKNSFLDEYISAYPSLTIETPNNQLSSTYKQIGGIVSEGEKNLLQLLADHDIRLVSISGPERYGLLNNVLDVDQSSFDELHKHYCPVPPVPSLVTRPETSLPQLTKTIEGQLKYIKDTVVFASFESIETMLHYQVQDPIQQSIIQTDKYLKKLIQQALVAGIRVLLIGDSSGADSFKEQGQETTSTLLPLVLITKDQEGLRASHDDYASDALFPLSPSGSLQDIAPTILSLMHIPKPEQLAGKNLFPEQR